MSKRRDRNKRPLIIAHREFELQQAIEDLIAGKSTPKRVSERARKLKAVRHG